MSLNKFLDITEEHKWMNINCNDLTLGVGSIKTKSYAPSIQLSGGNILTDSSLFIYQCDEISLRIKGWVNYTNSTTPQNSFSVTISIPIALKDRFSTGLVYSMGSLNEHPFNANTNSGSVAYGTFDNNQNVANTVYYTYNAQGATQIGFRVNLDIVIYNEIM
jgi:hypothetical protein